MLRWRHFAWPTAAALWFGGLTLGVRWAAVRLYSSEELGSWGEVDLGLAAGAIALAAFATVWGWLALERASRADPKGLATETFFWSLRALFQPAAIVVWAVVPILTGLLGRWIVDRFDIGCFLLLAIALFHLTWLSLLPFAVWRPSVVDSTAGAGWWHWPWRFDGTVAAGLIFLLQIPLQCVGLALAAPFFLLGLEAVTSAAWAVGELLGLILSTVIMPACAGALLSADPPSRAVPRLLQFLRWRGLGPVLALHVRLALLGLVILPPLVGLWFLQWKITPGLLDEYWARGEAPGRLLELLIAVVDLVGGWFWLPAAFALWLHSLLFAGRLAWHVERETPLAGDAAPFRTGA